MIAPALRRRVAGPAACATVAFALIFLFAAAGGGFASDWVADPHSAFRLIAGAPAQGLRRAGVEIRLAPGWKTYWRYPGDSGVPPRFDFTGSTNVKSVEVLWPAPHAWRDEAGTAVGYKSSVVFPLHVTAQDADQPVQLKLAFEYAICERICVPVSGEAALELPASGAVDDAALAAAEAQVPKRSAVGATSALAIRAVSVQTGAAKPQVLVDVAAPDGVPLDLLAEGPTPDWALPVPEPAGQGPNGTRRFAFVLDGAPPGVDVKGRDLTLTLTAVAGEDAIVVPFHLDASATGAVR